MPRDFQAMERELREAGHQVQRTYEAPVRSQQRAADAEWVFRVDSKVVARGADMAAMAEELERWIQEQNEGGAAG